MSLYDEEIDLKPYISALKSRWWLVVLVALLASTTAYVFTSLQPLQYKSTATILLTRSRPELYLAAQFPTVKEQFDPSARIGVVLSILESDSFASDVVEAMKVEDPSLNESISSLKNRVEVETKGDLLLVTAAAGDAITAAKVANQYARVAVKTVNEAYAEQQPLAEIEAQLMSAERDYRAAQLELENFITISEISRLEQQVQEAETLLTSIGRDRAWQISFYTNRKQAMESLLIQAEALKQQLEVSGSSTPAQVGDALSVLLARAQSFGIQLAEPSSSPVEEQDKSDNPDQKPTSGNITINQQSSPPVTIQLDGLTAVEIAGGDYARDLDHLIQLASSEGSKAEEKIQEYMEALQQSTEDPLLTDASAHLQRLKAQLEAAKSKEKELTGQRDITWQAFAALSQKVVEVKNGAATGNYANLAEQAIPSEAPASRGTLRNALVAGVLGLILSAGTILVSQWLTLVEKQPSKIPYSANPTGD